MKSLMHGWVAPASASALLGFGIWAASPSLTGVAEPWDAEFPYYSLTAVIGGAVVGWAFPRLWLWVVPGAWLGQVIGLGVLPGLDRGWLLLGVFTTGIGSLFFLPGAAFGAFLGRWMKKARGPQ